MPSRGIWLLKTLLWEKEKMMVTSIIFSSYNIQHQFEDNTYHWLLTQFTADDIVDILATPLIIWQCPSSTSYYFTTQSSINGSDVWNFWNHCEKRSRIDSDVFYESYSFHSPQMLSINRLPNDKF